MTNKIIFYSFAILFFLTPLFWTPWNYELFEYNKMMLTYALTIIICGAWLWKMIDQKRLIFNLTPLHIPLALFLFANILSTIFSIDVHTSIWGYYSRSNGGLLSTISYLLLFCAYVSNITKQQTLTLLKVTLAGGFIVALWAIPEHFGVSPSCVILRGDFNDSCWVQDVQSRVFASLGQPNWLAAYIGMLIFPALYFFLTNTHKIARITYYFILVTYYLAFTFTYSRGAVLGIWEAFTVLILVLTYLLAMQIINKKDFDLSVFLSTSLLIILILGGALLSIPLVSTILVESTLLRIIFILAYSGILITLGIKYLKHYPHTKNILLIIISFLIINLFFGSALARFQLGNLLPQSPVSTQANTPTNSPANLSQLETGGTESGEIRLIVWKGALDIFRHYPLFGSGVETFAYSYYLYRPVAHNLVSEWDFLYNKAHNEFLNYLATTGIFGFGTYMLIICVFMLWSVKKLLTTHRTDHEHHFLILALLVGYLSYLIQNFFGFSVVIIALLFYLFPAFAFVITDSTKQYSIPYTLYPILYTRSIYSKIAKGVVLMICCYLLFSLAKFWYADTLFALGEHASDTGDAGTSFNYLQEAADLNPDEPFYHSELGFAAASASVALSDTDSTSSAQLKNEAVGETMTALNISPNDVTFWTTAIRTYYALTTIDKSFNQKTLQVTDQAIKLAPTNPKLYYNKAIILGQLDDSQKKQNTQLAIQALQKAIQLKPNYREGYFALALFYFDDNQQQKAVQTMGQVLQLVPNDPDALKQLTDWGKKGVATEAATTSSLRGTK